LAKIAIAAALPPAIAQEETSLGEEDLAGSIVSNVLGGSDNNEEEENGGDAIDNESNQDAASTATEDSNQGQDVDQDDISTFGDETADLIQDQSQANVAVPIAIPINVHLIEEEEEEQPPGDEVSFCYDTTTQGVRCFPTLLDCERARAADDEDITPCVLIGPG
jgi:hypothetical protein